MKELIELLEKEPGLTNAELAATLGTTEENIASEKAQLEKDGILRGYRYIINKEKLGDKSVTALIEIKVTPKYGLGFDDIARKITEFDEVGSVYLMSGGFDLAVTVTGEDFQSVAMFVAKRLSPLESVVSTATHFILRRYKELGIKMTDTERDDRGIVSL